MEKLKCHIDSCQWPVSTYCSTSDIFLCNLHSELYCRHPKMTVKEGLEKLIKEMLEGRNRIMLRIEETDKVRMEYEEQLKWLKENRTHGFYWVKQANGEWTIGMWHNGWSLFGSHSVYIDSEFIEIGPMIENYGGECRSV